MVIVMKYIKKFWWIILILLIIIGISIFFIMNKDDSKLSNIMNISINELQNKYDNKETFIVVLTQTGCSHCEKYLPNLNKVLKDNNLTAFELNTTNLSDDEKATLARYISYSGTPTTVFIKNGEEETALNRLVGDLSQEKITERLKNMGYIK